MDQANSLPELLRADPDTVAVLALLLIVLLGPMLVSAVLVIVRNFALIASVAAHRLCQYLVDKITESIILMVLSLSGFLWLLDLLPAALK